MNASPMSRPVAGTVALLSGPRHLLLGFRLLLRPGVRGFMLIPVLGNTLLYSLAAALAFYGLDRTLDRWLPATADWLRWLLYPLLGVLLMVLALFTFTLLGNLILAPFNGLLSQRVERVLTGAVTSAPTETIGAAMRRSTRMALWRLGFVAIRIVGVFVLGLVPVVGVIALPLGIGLGAWLLALEFSDSPIGNWGWNLAQQRAMIRAHRAGFIGFGLAAMGLSLVPIVNFALIPAAVAGMTAYCLKLRDGDAPASAVRS
jgi:CysZ protein